MKTGGQPILDNAQLAAIKQMDHRGWRTAVIDTTYLLNGGSGAHRTDSGDDVLAALDVHLADETSAESMPAHRPRTKQNGHSGPSVKIPVQRTEPDWVDLAETKEFVPETMEGECAS